MPLAITLVGGGCLLLLALFACADPDAPTNPNDTTEVVYEVPKGATAGKLGGDLEQKGLVPSSWQWKLYLRRDDASCIKAGKHRLSPSMSMRQVKDALCGAPIPEDEPFTVVEGWRIRDIDAALVQKGWIKPGEYADAATKKTAKAPFDCPGKTYEGYLYPETYMVTPDRFSVDQLIERQLDTFKTRFLDHHQEDVAARGLDAVVIMASMLEREEPSPDNRPVVAGILWKRIDHGWALGVDATSRYELDDWNDRDAFLKHLRDPADPYNSRLLKGLPPTAIGNPSVSSLEAALKPVDSDFWYYLHDPTGQFHGAKDAAGHEANRAKYGVY